MLNQQLKQMQDNLIRLKSQKILTRDEEMQIKRLEKWFIEFDKEE